MSPRGIHTNSGISGVDRASTLSSPVTPGTSSTIVALKTGSVLDDSVSRCWLEA